jgi:hypothetical protein
MKTRFNDIMSYRVRQKKFIDSKIQGALVCRIILHWFVFLAVASLGAFILQVITNPFQPIAEHARQVWWTHGPFFLVMACLLPAFVYDTVKLSHRFTGPIYRLQQTIRSIIAGGPASRLKFRENDYWQGLAIDFNTMIERLTKGDDYLPEAGQEKTARRLEDEEQPAAAGDDTGPSAPLEELVNPVETS